MLDTRIRGRVLYGQESLDVSLLSRRARVAARAERHVISGSGRADILIRTPSIVGK
jgi:hypothetical protein